MSTTNSNPDIVIDFTDQDGKYRRKTFSNPVKVITTNDMDQVKNALEEIEDAVQSGLHVAGYMSYEAAPAFDPAFRVHDGQQMPLLWFGCFEEDNSLPSDVNLGSKEFRATEWEPSISIEQYSRAIDTIQTAIAAGDTYQVNYTMRFATPFEGDDFQYYERLRIAQNSNYCAYLNLGRFRILSASPELFFRVNGTQIMTKPMKGTVKRGETAVEDEANGSWLAASEKNRAENLMIVDLLRNDLGRVAVTGTVEVPKLFEIERYPTVFQMTSTVVAELQPSARLYDIMKALFPCGSITGAPKISSMNIIADLEDSPREAYCGTIGYISPSKEMVFNVAIRTVIVDTETQTAQYGVGGGIIWDSTSAEEYEEVLSKMTILGK